jgi:hypothetical protein
MALQPASSKDGGAAGDPAAPRMLIWTVYEKPSDFPELFVARPFIIGNGTARPMTLCLTGKTLAEVRAFLEPYGLTCIPRQEGDDPRIVETWL